MTPRNIQILLALVAVMCFGACSSVLVHRPTDPTLDAATTVAWVGDIEAIAQDGDIVLRRGYALVSDVVTLVTPGEDLSHASIYDAEHRSVIEAVDPVVHEIPLAEYVRGAHRVVIVRPRYRSAEERHAAVLRARRSIGTPFDYEGFVGIDDPDRFYCSELVVWAIGAAERGEPVDALVIPGELTRYGTTLYDSGERGAHRPLPRVAAR
jgi:uncharacterized protein YycO